MHIDDEIFQVSAGTVYMPPDAKVRFENGPATVAIQVFAGPSPAKKYDGWTARE